MSSISKREQIRADFLRSIANGWSVQVAMSHASCYDRKFRLMFAKDEEIQEIFRIHRERYQSISRGVYRGVAADID